jgi:alpha-tubulin suppressor-like RCC1 family protein
VATGSFFSAAFTSSGYLFTWGKNSAGQLGLGNVVDASSPTLVPFFATSQLRIKKICIGHSHCVALASDRKLYVWGDNSFGQLGLGDIENRALPTELSFFNALSPVKKIIAGAYFTIVLLHDGKLYGWGQNVNNQLHPEPEFFYKTPSLIKLPTTLRIDKIAAVTAAFIISDKGELYSWGANIGQFLNNEPNSITTEPRSVHLFPDTQKQINKLYVGHNHAIFASEGEYFGVGKNDHNQLLLDDLSLRNGPHKIAFLNALDAKKILSFESNTFVLTMAGEIYVYGANDSSRLSTSGYDNKIKYSGKFVDISVSESHVLALTEMSELVAWGYLTEADLVTEPVLIHHGFSDDSISKDFNLSVAPALQETSIFAVKIRQRGFYKPLVQLICPRLFDSGVIKTIEDNKGISDSALSSFQQFVHYLDCEIRTLSDVMELYELAKQLKFYSLTSSCLKYIAANKDLVTNEIRSDLKKSKSGYMKELYDAIEDEKIMQKSIDNVESKAGEISNFALAVSKLHSLRFVSSDCTLKVGKEEIGCHKIVLALRNDFFYRCFTSSLKESVQGVLDIPDENTGGISPSALKVLVEYLYKPNSFVVADPNDAISILLNSNYLCLSQETNPSIDHSRLMETCLNLVGQFVDQNNCREVFQMVEGRNCKLLEDLILQKMKDLSIS